MTSCLAPLPQFLLALLVAGLSSACFADSQAKHALVIGNTNYAKQPLSARNPASDAKLMASCLEGVGFKVQLALDLTLEQMDKAVDEFCTGLPQGSAAIVYFAGHGVQVNREHYLIPVDARIDKPIKVPYQTYAYEQLVSLLEATKSSVRLVILDSVKNNPWERSWRSADRSTPTGAFCNAFAPAPVSGTAVIYHSSDSAKGSDGTAGNSVFASAFSSVVSEPPAKGLLLLDAIRHTCRSIARDSKQQVWLQYPPAMPECWLVEPTSTSAAKPPMKEAEKPGNEAALAEFLLKRADVHAAGSRFDQAIELYAALLDAGALDEEAARRATAGRGASLLRRGQPGDLANAIEDHAAAGESMMLKLKDGHAAFPLVGDGVTERTATAGELFKLLDSVERDGATWLYVAKVDADRLRGWAPIDAFASARERTIGRRLAIPAMPAQGWEAVEEEFGRRLRQQKTKKATGQSH